MEEIKKELEELLKENDFLIVKDVNSVNHNPHPYTIGPKHVNYASDNNGGIMDNSVLEKVKCAHPGCQLDYSEHKSDKVVFFQLKRNALKEEVQETFESLIPVFEKNKIDGYVFVDTEEKFRIG